MLTKKVKNRILFLVLIFLIFSTFVYFIMRTLDKNILYFSTPSEINQTEEINTKRVIRIGGMVKKQSIKTSSDNIQFIITDFDHDILVVYSGTVPNLFAEGKGVVAEGKLKDKSFFIANRILAKHDENYMPQKSKKNMEYNVR